MSGVRVITATRRMSTSRLRLPEQISYRPVRTAEGFGGVRQILPLAQTAVSDEGDFHENSRTKSEHSHCLDGTRAAASRIGARARRPPAAERGQRHNTTRASRAAVS